MKKQKNKLFKLIRYCYRSIEKAEVLTGVLEQKYSEEKNTSVILEIISNNIENIKKLIFEIQYEIK